MNFWQRRVKKCIYTLNIDNFAPEVCEITYPFLRRYAERIGAEFHIITERKFPNWPVTYEKFQIYELAQEMNNEWSIYIDSDALIHPDFPDITTMLPKDTCLHWGKDFAPVRWTLDRFFLRDGRYIGSGNWFAMASDWCVELWRPLNDLTFEEAVGNIQPTVQEVNSGVIDPHHLIDDYTCSRNIAKYGLKFITARELFQKMGIEQHLLAYHQYLVPPEAKVLDMIKVLQGWGLVRPGGGQ